MHRRRWMVTLLMVAGICLGFFGTVFASLTYMAKDYNAYNLVYAFFNVGRAEQMALTRLPISRLWLLRVLNVSHVLFVMCSMLYVLPFSELFPRRPVRVIRGVTLSLAAVQALFLDPQFCIWLYMERIGPFAGVHFFRGFYALLPAALRWITIAELIFAVVLLAIALMRTPRSQRSGTGVVALVFTGLTFVYLYLFSWLPTQPMWLSRVASYVRYDSLPVYKPTAFNSYMPVLSTLFVLSFLLVALHLIRVSARERRHNQAFRSQISAVETASRVFCHYLKNELLAQQAELKLLSAKVEPPLQPDVQFIIQRNDEIYQRLSAVRETMRQQRLTLLPLSLTELLRGAAAQMELPNTAAIELRLPNDPILVQGNADQLREVVACLLRNALEAGREDHLRIVLSVARLRRYASVSIANNGPRIAPEKRDVIFDPFYTTKPAKSNWGLGLALCKNIVTLHRGRIWVDEQNDGGALMTVFHLLLPLTRE